MAVRAVHSYYTIVPTRSPQVSLASRTKPSWFPCKSRSNVTWYYNLHTIHFSPNVLKISCVCCSISARLPRNGRAEIAQYIVRQEQRVRTYKNYFNLNKVVEATESVIVYETLTDRHRMEAARQGRWTLWGHRRPIVN